jgi:hypothetical protein
VGLTYLSAEPQAGQGERPLRGLRRTVARFLDANSAIGCSHQLDAGAAFPLRSSVGDPSHTTSREIRELAMLKTIVGCSVVICCGVLLMPWLVDTGTPVAARDVRGGHHLVVAELASVPLAEPSNARLSAK